MAQGVSGWDVVSQTATDQTRFPRSEIRRDAALGFAAVDECLELIATAASIGGGSYAASSSFQIAFALAGACGEPASSHVS